MWVRYRLSNENLLRCMGPFMALNGHAVVASQCPLSQDERAWHRRALRSVDDPQGGHANHNDERPLSLSSEPQLRFGLCRQPREPLRSARGSRAHMILAET